MIMRSVMIDVRKIKQHPMNPRKDLGDLTELIDSIRKQGILQNLTVVSDPEASEEFERFIAVIGHRRLAAAKSAGLSEVPCNIVEMTMQEQLVTMMSENMQRADLTPYEQAHGFQTMLDFGEDLESITVKTGFSESTVRRRLKLLELDQPKLKAAVDKGVSLVDLMRLEKIEDQEERNKVLADIGTNNFEWSLKRAIDKQKEKKKTEERLLEISGWAREFTDDDEWQAAKRVAEFYAPSPAGKQQIDEPSDSKTIQYIYRVGVGGWIYIRKIAESNSDELEEENRKKAEEEKRNELRDKMDQLKSLHSACRELRKQYVMSISEKQSKLMYKVVMRQMLYNAVSIWGLPDQEDFLKFLGIQEKADAIDRFVGLLNDEHSIEQTCLIYAYLTLDDKDKNTFDWGACYNAGNAESFLELKNYMTAIGYQMSDEETSILDGTHPLYTKKEEGKQSDG